MIRPSSVLRISITEMIHTVPGMALKVAVGKEISFAEYEDGYVYSPSLRIVDTKQTFHHATAEHCGLLLVVFAYNLASPTVMYLLRYIRDAANARVE